MSGSRATTARLFPDLDFDLCGHDWAVLDSGNLILGLQVWIADPWVINFFGERLGVVLMALVLGAMLTLLGHKRRDFFLALGNVNAKAEGMRLAWSIAGPMIALLLAALTVAAILSMVPLSSVMLAVVIPRLPAVFFFALMNAFGEELAYRATLLSQLWEIVGKRHAIWMTALWFGLGHYYGGISFGAKGPSTSR